MAIITEIAGCRGDVRVQWPPGRGAPASARTASVIIRKRFKCFQPKQDLGVQGAGRPLGLGLDGLRGRARKDLLTDKSQASGDILTVSVATGVCRQKGSQQVPLSTPPVCPSGMGGRKGGALIWPTPLCTPTHEACV